jgi:hypothetical protein
MPALTLFRVSSWLCRSGENNQDLSQTYPEDRSDALWSQTRRSLKQCPARPAAVYFINRHLTWHYVFCWKWLNSLEGRKSVVCQVLRRDKEIGEARHVYGTSIVLQGRYTFYNLHFSFETSQRDSFTGKHSAPIWKVHISISRANLSRRFFS